MKPDMDLSEFMALVTVRELPDTQEYAVDFLLANGKNSTLTVSNCHSEYDAKERAYLYLVDLVYGRPK